MSLIVFGHGPTGTSHRTWLAAPRHPAGNRRQQTFFGDEDYRTYLELMAEWCAACEVEIWAYCLMPIMSTRGGLARVIREEDIKLLRVHENTGRPLGDEAFLASLEQDPGRILRRQKPGTKGKPRR